VIQDVLKDSGVAGGCGRGSGWCDCLERQSPKIDKEDGNWIF